MDFVRLRGAGAAPDKQPHYLQVTRQCGLMQRRGVSMGSFRIEPVRVFPGVEQ